MAAKIHRFPGATAEADTQPEHRLVVELRTHTGEAMRAVVRRMFETADDLVYDMGENAASDAERRRYFDAVRALRLHRQQVEDGFADALQSGFTIPANTSSSTELDADELSLQSSEELEARIAVGNLVARADGVHRNLIWETERRLTQAIDTLQLRISGRALSPEHLGSAFGDAAISLPTEFEIKLIIFKLFERRLITDLEDFYRGILEIFDRHGVGRTRPLTKSVYRKTAAAAPKPRAETDETLRKLADRWFDTLTGAGLLPRETRSLLEPLRKPVIDAALADFARLDDPRHPLRVALSEAVDLAVAARAGDAAADERLRDRITAWPATVANAAGPANEGPAAGPAAGNTLAQVLQRQLTALEAQSRERHTHLLRGVRRMVAQELQLTTAEYAVPQPVLPLLRSGIAPLLAVALLRHGRASEAYRDARGLLDQVLDSIKREQEAAERDALILSLDKALADIGMDRTKIDRLLGGLREIYDALQPAAQAQAAPEPPPAPEPAVEITPEKPEPQPVEPIAASNDSNCAAVPEPPAPAPAPAPEPAAESEPPPSSTDDGGDRVLRRLLRLDAWYRVYDAELEQTRWLKLDAFDLRHGVLAFSGFDSNTELRISVACFAEDVACGRSEPISPGDDERLAIKVLRRRYQEQNPTQ